MQPIPRHFDLAFRRDKIVSIQSDGLVYRQGDLIPYFSRLEHTFSEYIEKYVKNKFNFKVNSYPGGLGRCFSCDLVFSRYPEKHEVEEFIKEINRYGFYANKWFVDKFGELNTRILSNPSKLGKLFLTQTIH